MKIVYPSWFPSRASSGYGDCRAEALRRRSRRRQPPRHFRSYSKRGQTPSGSVLVASLDRPGGNITGITQSTTGLVPKLLEVLHELLPAATIVALLVNPADPALGDNETREAISAAQTLGLQLHVLKASTEADLEPVFANLSQLQAGGLIIGPDAFFTEPS